MKFKLGDLVLLKDNGTELTRLPLKVIGVCEYVGGRVLYQLDNLVGYYDVGELELYEEEVDTE